MIMKQKMNYMEKIQNLNLSLKMKMKVKKIKDNIIHKKSKNFKKQI